MKFLYALILSQCVAFSANFSLSISNVTSTSVDIGIIDYEYGHAYQIDCSSDLLNWVSIGTKGVPENSTFSVSNASALFFRGADLPANAQLTLLYDDQDSESEGQLLEIRPSWVGVLTSNMPPMFPGFCTGGGGLPGTVTTRVSYPSDADGTNTLISPTPPDSLFVKVDNGTDNYSVTLITNQAPDLDYSIGLTVFNGCEIAPFHLIGSIVTRVNTNAATSVGTLLGRFGVTVPGDTFPIILDQPYTNAAQVVWIGNGQYIVEPL